MAAPVLIPAPSIDTARRDVVVVGGGAGAIDTLARVLAKLPGDFPAAILVALHTLPSLDHNAEIVRRASHLQVLEPASAQCIQRGAVYVPPLNHHLIVQNGELRRSWDAKVNRARPAIDPLFESAAVEYGPRVIGLILSGVLDDGTFGLWKVKNHGGIAVVQHPADALFPGMPLAAIDKVEVDYSVPADELGDLLVSLTNHQQTGSFSDIERSPHEH
jgi:two-component system, chemotaxis family, protein-glutamate methylesterase/glutaminase